MFLFFHASHSQFRFCFLVVEIVTNTCEMFGFRFICVFIFLNVVFLRVFMFFLCFPGAFSDFSFKLFLVCFLMCFSSFLLCYVSS